MRPFCAPLPLTGAVDQYRLEMTGQMERSHAHGHKPMLPGIDCQYENVKRGYRMKVIDMHCDTISELHKDHLKGGSASILENSLMIDLKKMQAGDYGLPNFALFTSLERAEGKPF